MTLGGGFHAGFTPRVSFEVGMAELGGTALFLSGADLQLGRGETIPDTARVLSRFVHGIMARVFAQEDVEGLTAGTVEVLRSPVEAVTGADAVYTDVWASMGQEEEHERRMRIFADYQVNEALFAKAKPDAIFMPCLPAHRGEEVTDEVVDHPRSVVLDEAENRLHVQKALLLHLIGGEKLPA